MRKDFIFWILAVLLLGRPDCIYGVITVSTTETWDGGQMHGITPGGAGTAADPYVYVVPDGMVLTGMGVIRTGDEYVIFDFGSGSTGLDMASGSYFDLTGSSRLSDPGEITIVLGQNSLTGAGDFKTTDVTKDSKDVNIAGAGDVCVDSFYLRTRDAFSGDVSIDVGGSVNIGSIDTQDVSYEGNNAGSVVIYGYDVTVGAVDTRCLRTASSTGSSGNVVLQARDYDGTNSFNNTIRLSGSINTDSAAGTDGDISISGVVVRLESGFDAVAGGGSLDICAGIVKPGMTADDLFIDNSGGDR
jgi:hypothetical protein